MIPLPQSQFRLGNCRSPRRRLRPVMVWLSALSCGTGCLVAPPPEFQDQTSERPNVNTELVVPPISQILVTGTKDQTISLTIPYTGRDAGEEVIVQLWLNWGLENETYIGQASMDPSAEDVERTYQGTWRLNRNTPPGCQQLSVLLSHESNVPNDSPFRPVDPNLVARLTWWMNVDVSASEQQELVNCPTAGP